MAKQHKYALYPILITYFLDNFGLAVIYPIFSPLFLHAEFGLLPTDATYFQRTILFGFLISTFPLAQFFGAPLIGEFSDRFGRKKAFYITILGTGIGYCFTAVSIQYSWLVLLYISRFWTGFFAGNLAICLAAVSDMSLDEKTRAKNYGLVGGIGGLSFIIAILAGGSLADPKHHDLFAPSMPFWLIFFLSLVNITLMALLFKESHVTQTKKKKLHPIEGIHHILSIIKIKKLKIAYLVFFFFMVSWVTSMQFLPTYLIHIFSADATVILWTFVGIGAVWALANLFINRFLSYRYFPFSTLKTCLLILGVFLLLTLFPEQQTFFLITIFGAVFCAALSWTNCLTVVSFSASNAIQGSILGINQSIGAMASIFGPTIGGLLGGVNTHLVYAFTGLSCLIAFAILFFNRKYLALHKMR